MATEIPPGDDAVARRGPTSGAGVPTSGAGAAPVASGGSANVDDAGESDEEAAVATRRLSPGVRNTIEWIVVIGGAVVITILLRTFAFQTYYIPSASMMPTLEIQDRIVVNKIADDFHVGDIVVFDRPDTWRADHDVLIKRIVGEEGQTIEVRDNVLIRDGEPVDEPYLPDDVSMPDVEPYVVPEDHVFVMGDNRDFSSDSRENGPVPEDHIVGRAALRIWPIGDFGGL